VERLVGTLGQVMEVRGFSLGDLCREEWYRPT
jgi:hypothetical protein